MVLHTGRSWDVVRGKPVAARGLVNGWMALAPDGMERSGRFSRYHLPTTGKMEGVTEKVTEKVTERVTEKVTGRVTEKVTERVTERMTEGLMERLTEGVEKIEKSRG